MADHVTKKRAVVLPVIKRKTTAYDLLTKIIKVGEQEPRRIRMEWWGARPGDYDYPSDEDRQPACGTVGCIAGWACILARDPNKKALRKRVWERAPEVAARLLGFGTNSREMDELFDGGTDTEPGTVEHVREVTERIRAFQREHADHLKAKVIRPGQSRW